MAISAGVLIEGFYKAIGVTVLTGSGLVSGQLERDRVVIERGRTPTRRVMAGSALVSKSAHVGIVSTMAGGAILRGALVLTILMAALTGDRSMLPVQMERELRVINIGWFPSSGRMTGIALRAELSLMIIIAAMAGETILRGGLQLIDRVRIDMACRAFCRSMLTDQFERNIIVIKVLTQRFDAVMTRHTIGAESQEVISREGLVNLKVTVSTGSLVEGRSISADVTIFTSEGRAVRLGLVRSQFEGNRIMIERSRTPTRRRVTGSALSAKRAGMRIILKMAGHTILRGPLEHIIDMAVCAIHACVLPIQFECKFRVIHIGGLPASGRMTGIALCAKCAAMRIIIDVTGSAVHGGALEDAILVTIHAVNACMFAIEMECKFGMVYICGFPAGGTVTGSALSTELAIMRIIINMAGDTIHGRALEYTILVAVHTVCFGMLAVKMEGKLGVVDRGRYPAGREMAGGAIGPQLTVMVIILFMAGETRLRSCFQVREVAGIDMAG